jgi:pectinesterase
MIKAISVCAGLLTVVLTGCATVSASSRPAYSVKPVCNGEGGCYTRVQAALDASAGDTTSDWIIIEIAPGLYHEKVTVRRPKTELRGAGADRTRIEFDAVAETAGQYHRTHWGTPGSATLTVDSDEVTIDGLTIENSFDFLKNDALPAGDPRKIANSQAVAFLADIHSDRVRLVKSALVGNQDTLFANGKRVWVRESFISGNIDFIFGNGEVLIEDSTIQSRRRATPFVPGEFQSFLVAPSTPLSQTLGIVVYRSRLTREAGVPDGSVALGRPWHPTTTFPDGHYGDPNAVGQASFIDCFMDAHIRSDHWTQMNGTARDGTKTARFLPQDSRFSETGSSGPGGAHSDIGITWGGALGIDAVHKIFFENWTPGPSH